MATYKIPQDIEAEDKVLGPLGIRQLVYAMIVAVLGFINFRLLVSGLWFIALPFIFPMILFAILAAPLGGDQPTETWLLAKVRFLTKPRIRIWDQAGIKKLVTITAPKKEEHSLTNGLSQGEVKSRLQALANTLDSRGWALKNVNISIYGQPVFAVPSADRLIDEGALPSQVPEYDIQAADDIMDTQANPLAHQMDQLMQQSAATYHTQIVDNFQKRAASTATLPPLPTQEQEQAFLEKRHAEQASEKAKEGKQRRLEPIDEKAPGPVPKTPVTPTVSPAILELAKAKDLNVASLASLANRPQPKSEGGNELVIPH